MPILYNFASVMSVPVHFSKCVFYFHIESETRNRALIWWLTAHTINVMLYVYLSQKIKEREENYEFLCPFCILFFPSPICIQQNSLSLQSRIYLLFQPKTACLVWKDSYSMMPSAGGICCKSSVRGWCKCSS